MSSYAPPPQRTVLPWDRIAPGEWKSYPWLRANQTIQPSDGALDAFAFPLSKAQRFQAIGTYVNSPGSAGAVARLGIYADLPTGPHFPGALRGGADFGTVDTTSAGEKSIVIDEVLSPGLWWLAIAVQGAPATRATLRALDAGVGEAVHWPWLRVTAALVGLTFNQTCWTKFNVAGALPDPFPTDALDQAACMLVGLKAA